MTDAEKREAARQFFYKWNGQGREDEDDRSYWLDILQRIMGAEDATDRIKFQKKVIVDGNTKRIDAYIPETKIIIEQKSFGIALDKKLPQSGGMELTPYEQAKRYNDNLPSSEKVRWIVTSNFAEIWVYDMDTRIPEENITKISIADLQSHYSLLNFLLKKEVRKITEETELSLKAGELVGKIHDSFMKQYNDPTAKKAQDSLNVLCVRLVFCLYAEDAGLFGDRSAFSSYLAQYQPKDIRQALISLFKVLDTPTEERADMYLDEELEAFPYCNGGLFANEDIIIPKITQEIKDALEEASHFDWSRISPTIFGAVFESTLNENTRRSGGMHYTSIENIHKVIDPLFLDGLRDEFAEAMKIGVIKTREARLKAFQEKLSGLKFLDPACGSGNFLTETYISLRRLENDVLRELQHGQIAIGDGNISPIKVGIDQFYGIEINDFAVAVAKTALWIAESQMMKETEDVCSMTLDFLPLKTNACIVEGNALRLDWNEIVRKNELSYIMGNPPFVGGMYMTSSQKDEIRNIFTDVKGAGELDYVCGWYKICADFIEKTNIKCAFVSTNSICQGESVPIFWRYMIQKCKIQIDYAYTTFVWNNEAKKGQAKVHCVIIGFSKNGIASKKLFSDNSIIECRHISPYLTNGDDFFVDSRSTPLCKVPPMRFGSMPRDGGGFVLSVEEKTELIKKYPICEKWIKPYIGAVEFLNNKERYCLWLVDANSSELTKCKMIMDRIESVYKFRLSSKAAGTRKFAETPTLFCQIAQPDSDYIIVPKTSSGKRRYLPIGFQPKDVIASDLVFLIPNATLYEFAVLMSNVHNSWLRQVAGRLKSDYRYSKDVVYNNFPWPDPTDEQRAKIEETAQGILDARAMYPNDSLAALYDPLTMPPELRKAHQANDRAVMRAYGLDVRNTSEEDCVAFLMKRYQELTKE